MTAEILLKYIHFICIFVIVGALVGEHLLMKSEMTRQEIKRVGVLDAMYGIAAVVILAAGFTMWFNDSIAKSADYYSQNWIFLTKIGLFSIVGILSIFPSLFLSKQKKGNPDETVQVPKQMVWYIRIELLLLFLMPLFATLMAKGIGYFG